ncbi:MAG: TRAM domain-containing protein, partial [Phycisphaerales bacterium]
DEVKRRRNVELLKRQEQISLESNQKMIGQCVEVLIEGYSKAAIKAQEAEETRGAEVAWRTSSQLVGRTRADQIVVFEGKPGHIGRFGTIRIGAATALTLHGDLQEETLRGSPVQVSGQSPLHVLE